jgi:cytochrome c oxidase cbb3-type subunit 1
MWRTYTDSGTLKYSFIDSLIAMHPYYVARAFGGLLFLIGAAIGLYNVVMTIRHTPRAVPAYDYPTSSEALEPAVPAAE